MNPLQIEEAFHRLKVRLRQSASSRWHLREVASFVDLLTRSGATHEAESYLVEVLPVLSHLSQQLNPAGLDPEILALLLGQLEDYAASLPLLGEMEAYEETRRRLRRSLALLYAWVGEPGQAEGLLEGDLDEVLEAWLRLHSPGRHEAWVPVVEHVPEERNGRVGGLRRLRVQVEVTRRGDAEWRFDGPLSGAVEGAAG